jgi:hypothetical protein
MSAPEQNSVHAFFATGLIWFCLFLYITTCSASCLILGTGLWLRGERQRLEAELRR